MSKTAGAADTDGEESEIMTQVRLWFIATIVVLLVLAPLSV